MLGLLDLYLALPDDHADRVRQVPDSAGDVGGCRGSGTACPGFVLHPHLVGADADAVLVALHVVDVQAFRVIQLPAQFLVVTQRRTLGLDVDRIKVLVVIKQHDQVCHSTEHEVLFVGDSLELPSGAERDADRAAGGRNPLRPVVGQDRVRVGPQESLLAAVPGDATQ